MPGLVVDERVKSALPTMETAACAEPVRITAAARMVDVVFFMVVCAFVNNSDTLIFYVYYLITTL